MIEVEGVSFAYEEGGPTILHDINLTIPQGQWLAIIGPNGSGKSTLARHLNGLLLPAAGRVLVEGLDSRNQEELWQLREQVAFVFQNPDNQLVATTVEDDIAFGPENLGLSPQEITRRVEDALAITNLADLRKKPPHLLSGGEKQRVAIAGALAMASRYLVLDEPTSMLDPSLRLSVIETLQYLHKELGLGIIYVTNIMEEAYLAQRVIILEQGHLIAEGAPKEIFALPDFTRLGLEQPDVYRLGARLGLTGVSSVPELVAKLLQLKYQVIENR
ncbi:MAG: energy-coupling factor transporter ATPase [Clostridiales bacterium]|jgi:energy-coupling factor transport system ATP-binding protein|nr:energy-coupling factor transporter ATPase [Clostridiales bacterium]